MCYKCLCRTKIGLLGAVKSHDFIGKVQIRIGSCKREPHRVWRIAGER